MVASLLASLASLSWGTADFWAGLESRKTDVRTAALIGQGVAALALVVLLLVRGPEAPPAAALIPAVLGGAGGGVGALLQYLALALLDTSIAPPSSPAPGWSRCYGDSPEGRSRARCRSPACDDAGRDRGDPARTVTR